MTGILLVDKEQDWTSNDVVAKLRGILGERKIGHAGTLDPLATGLLVIMLGRATKASDYLMKHDKRYIAQLRPGIQTDTQDITGNVIGGVQRDVTLEEVRKAAACLTGVIQQTPPMFSAIKRHGQKLYDIARRGETVEREPRTITISSLSVVGTEGKDYILDISCSSGTYVRTICHDIGMLLGCGGCMSKLRRMESGDFTVGQAHTISELSEASKETIRKWIIPVEKAFLQFEAISMSERGCRKLFCGEAVPVNAADGKYRVVSSDNTFLMLGQVQKGLLRKEIDFFEGDR